MIERELTALAEVVAPPVPDDLAERVLARIDDLGAGSEPRPTRVRALVAAAVAALVAASFLSPQVRAFAADLLEVAGIEISSGSPDAPPEPHAPLPDSRPASLVAAQAQVDFPIRVPEGLGPPDRVRVADDGRVVRMSWGDREVLLDQFDGSLGPVFAKEVQGASPRPADVGGSDAWWIGSHHDLTYVDRAGVEITETARLAGHSLVWETGGVTFRLEGERLTADEAVAIARTVR